MSIPLRCPTPAIRRESIFRYLGCGNRPTQEVEALCDALLPEFLAALDCRACFQEAAVTVEGNLVTLSGLAPIRSAALARNLAGCTRAILFAATIGSAADRLRMQTQVRSPARAVVLDAMGTAAIEALCDSLCADWRRQAAPQQLRPRFSPGYGDLPLSLQKDLCAALDAQRRLGIYVNESMLMTPQKSVTALIGLSSAPQMARIRGCGYCSMGEHCPLRKGGKHCGL